MRASWLKERGVEDPYYTSVRTDSGSGLRCIGRWSFGPSYDVDGRTTPSETLVALARGSGVSLLKFSRQDSLSIELLSDINAEGLMCRVKVAGTLLYVGSRRGLEIYNIANERSPVRLSWIPLPLNDFDVQDSLAYTISGGYTDISDDDSFRIYSISNPANPVFRGACRDSGSIVSVAGNAAFLGDRWGLYVIDVTNPTSPHRIGSWGSDIEQVHARGSLCFVTTRGSEPGDITFHILDVAVPSLPHQIGSLDSAGGNDVFLVDTLAFGAGENDFNRLTIISIADSTAPRLIGWAATGGWSMGIWTGGPAQEVFVGCHWEGLQIYDTRNTSQPVRDTFLLGCDQSVDIDIDGERAYVANDMAGLKILDISDPTGPSTLGSYDTTWQRPFMTSIVARDSFVFVDWSRPKFRTLDVADPTDPVFAGTCELFNYPEDMVVRDSFVYCAEMNRFQVVNVARPREPVLVGSCNISGTGVDLLVRDTLAYVSSLPTQIVNLANPTSPSIIGTIPTHGNGLAVRDSIAFAPALYDSMVIYNVRNPSAPVRIGRHTFSGGHVWNAGIALVGTLLYVGGDLLHVIDVSDPLNPTEVTVWRPPDDARRLVYDSLYLYAACYEAGVCILETMPTGIEERMEKGGVTSQFSVSPSITDGPVVIKADSRVMQTGVCLYDAAGARVNEKQTGVRRDESGFCWWLDLSDLPDGIYFVNLRGNDQSFTAKVVKTRRR